MKPPLRTMRKASGPKPGKHPREPGMHLVAVENPDVIAVHEPEHRGKRLSFLEPEPADLLGGHVRQVFYLLQVILMSNENRPVATARRLVPTSNPVRFPWG